LEQSLASARKENDIMASEEKRVIVPRIDVAHNEKDTGLKISVNLAGAPREGVELEMGKEGLCVKAEADRFKYETCFMLAHKVKYQEAKAKFESGLLNIDVPFDDMMHGYKVPIE
jgi:HSP20 family molecular chaperone IbpA